MYSIGEAAKLTGISAFTLRYYEKIGVLPRPDRASGARRYNEQDLRYIQFIDGLKRTGMSLEEITAFTESGCLLTLDAEAAALDELLSKRIRLLREHMERLTKQIEELQQTKAFAAQKCEYYAEVLRSLDSVRNKDRQK